MNDCGRLSLAGDRMRTSALAISERCIQLGFSERVRGSHHLFDKEGIAELINIQSRGGQAKPYQVRQVRNIILKYKLGGED